MFRVAVVALLCASAWGTEFTAAAVGTRLLVNNSVSYRTFAAQFETAPGAQLHVYGETVGLFSAFVGSRGAASRIATNLAEAFALLLLRYAPQVEHYKAQYPKIPVIRALELALTDVMWRAFHSTFSEIAQKSNSYVIAGTLAPREVIESTNPSDIAFFGDPDLKNQTSVFLPSNDEVFNAAYLFDPTGAVAGRTLKVHLTPDEISLLHLQSGNLSDLVVNSIPGVGRACIAICFDAFFSDVLAHYDNNDCELLIQPSYNLGGMWAAPADNGVWQPQDWMSGPLGGLQPTYKNIRASINTMAVGNLFDMPGDGQSSINMRSANAPTVLFIGVESNSTTLLGDVLAMAPWVTSDPVQLPLAQRRQQLEDISKQLAPHSHAPLEDGYVSSLITAKIVL